MSRGRWGTLAGLAALMALSVYARTRNFDLGFWIDEGLSVGIADRPVSEIPGALRLDGSPPLYYVLLHWWMPLAGSTEEATHALSLLFATLTVPTAWFFAREVFGDRAGWIAALLAALNPFLSHYAQETRMYALVILLGTVACGAFALALAQGRRGWVPVLATALAALLYTHNWALFFATACGLVWIVLVLRAPSGRRRPLARDGALAFGGALVLWAPWLPTVLFQAAHTGAPWAKSPNLEALRGVLGQLVGEEELAALLLVAGFGVVGLARRRGAVAVLGLAAIAVLTVLLAFVASQIEPAWAVRYLAIALPPVLLACAGGLAHAGRLGVAAAVLVALMWIGDDGPDRKSNVRDIADSIAPAVRPGDLVVSTQPEQIPVLDYYLPDGLSYATLWGRVSDVGVTDWRDGVARLRRTSARADLGPLIDALPAGQRLVLVEPTIYSLDRWSAPWTSLVRVRSTEWRRFLAADERVRAIAFQPPDLLPQHPNAVHATVFVKQPMR